MFTRGLSFAWLWGFDTCSRRKGRTDYFSYQEKSSVKKISL